ncbi:hypothetical protein Vafri_16946 [Volvox africanus]|uniref:Uncharacterized protein n=1 Tax=Volvox africanus TaxID=51714 RepID=A0A8J4BJ60_9CHLO|nr:hypothetical protein Vafri_16946 [Volvox africanus]
MEPEGSELALEPAGAGGVVVHVSSDDDEATVFLAWKDLTVTARRHMRPLLNGVTGKITAGFYAIMVSLRSHQYFTPFGLHFYQKLPSNVENQTTPSCRFRSVHHPYLERSDFSSTPDTSLVATL